MLKIFLGRNLKRQILKYVIARTVAIKACPQLAKIFRKVSDVGKLSPAPFVPVRNGGYRSKFYPIWIKRWVLPISASIPSENWNSAGKRLLICDPLRFMFAQENHCSARSNLIAEGPFVVVPITDFGIRESSTIQLLPDRFNQC